MPAAQHQRCKLLVLVVAAACSTGAGPPPPPPPCPANSICMTEAAFYTTPASTPPSLTVTAGSAVAWRNTSGQFHNVTFANPTAAGAVADGSAGNIPEHTSGTNSRAFAAAGTQSFQCTLHAGMAGTVVVQ